jgi:hypothetical protein
MPIRAGLSSEVYPIDPKDLAGLPDAPFAVAPRDPVTLLLGSPGSDAPDSLVSGRERAIEAAERGDAFVPVRVAFIPAIPRWNPAPLFVRAWRDFYVARSPGIYHTDPMALRGLGIERGRRTRGNAFDYAPARRGERGAGAAKYDALTESIRREGWIDAYPFEIMLLRQMGAQDNLNDGHHRMGICAACGIRRATVRFVFAGAAPDSWLPMLRPLARVILRAKRRM